MAQHSVAYDFELFEEKKQSYQPELKVVEGQNNSKRVHRLQVIKATMGVILVVAVMATIVYNRSILTEVSHQVVTETAALQTAQNEGKRLSAKLESKMSTQNMEEKVLGLGLSELEDYQVKYVQLSSGDKLQVSKDAVKETPEILQKIGSACRGFLEYIGLGFNKN